MEALTISVPAKVNLHLQVVGKRVDGFHEVRTLLQSIDLFDELHAESTDDGELELVVNPAGAAPADDSNLVLRAARALRDRHGHPHHGARFALHKRIPAGGGLGGGSADAAAALVLCERLWRLEVDAAQRHDLAAGLGSDVPFFLLGGLAIGVGRGEEVYPLADLPEAGVVVAMPHVHVPTPEAYGRLGARLTWDAPDVNVYAFAAGIEDRFPWQRLRNDLQAVVLEGWPGVAEVLSALQRTQPSCTAVTGSGAAAFAVYPDRAAAEKAAAVMAGRWFVHAGVTLGREHSAPTLQVSPMPGGIAMC